MTTRRALVVEDSPTMRQIILMALRRIPGLECFEADDGVTGLRELTQRKFDILVTDINMPIMDGLKLVSIVRKDDVHRNIPIVIITTEGAAEDRQRAMSLGADAYLNKPIRAKTVIQTVRDLLEKGRPTTS